MTWFLKGTAPSVPVPTTPDLPLTSFWDGLSASASNLWRNSDGAGLHRREVVAETDALMMQTLDIMGRDKALDFLKGKGITNPAGLSADFLAYTPQVRDMLLDEARAQSDADPKAWQGVDLSMDGIDARVTERRKAEDVDEQAIIAMSPHPVAESLIGGVAAGVADPKQWPLLAINPGGSFLRFVGYQALLGGAGAAINIPAEQRVAAELGNEPPDVLNELTLGALSGAVLGGAVKGVPAVVKGLSAFGRGLAYHADRTKPLPGDHLIDSAESALRAGADPAEAVTKALQAEPPPPPREPLFLDGSMRVNTPEPTALAPDPITTSEIPPASGEAPQTTGALAALANDAIDRTQGASAALDAATAADTKSPKPLMAWIKSGQQPNKRSVAKAAREGRTLQPYIPESDLRIDPNGTLGQELKAQDITPKTAPGIWRKGGRDTLDNIVASEMEDQFPGILDATGTQRGADYLDRDGLAALLVRDANGDKSWLHSNQDAARAADDLAYEQRVAAGEIAPESVASSTGWNVDPGAYELFNPNGLYDLERDVSAYLDERWGGNKLTASERAEITRELSTNGGNAEDVIERVLSREQSFQTAEGPPNHADLNDPAYQAFIDEAARARTSEYSGLDTGGPSQDAGPARLGASDQGDAFGVETGAMGTQYIVPGTERSQVANRDAALIALKQQQSKLRRPDQARVEDDANGLFAEPNLDLFDDMGSPQAKAFMDQSVAYLREASDQGFGVDVPLGLVTDEGTQLHTAQDVLDELDDMDAIEREFRACLTSGVTDGA